jgi:hypothetical protein
MSDATPAPVTPIFVFSLTDRQLREMLAQVNTDSQIAADIQQEIEIREFYAMMDEETEK